MKISAKGRYALRLMMDVAEHDSGSPIKVKDIARRQDIPEKYCEQIISGLVKAGLLTSLRGAQGGYLLAKDAGSNTAGHILAETEGGLSFSTDNNSGRAVSPRTSPGFNSRAEVATEILFDKLSQAVADVLDNTTLEELLGMQPEMGNDYVI